MLNVFQEAKTRTMIARYVIFPDKKTTNYAKNALSLENWGFPSAVGTTVGDSMFVTDIDGTRTYIIYLV